MPPTTPTNTDGTCPPNWVAWGSDCYAFPSSDSDIVSYWNDGMTKCQQLAGDEFIGTLASVHSEAENNFIYQTFIERSLHSHYGSAYIGFKQDLGSLTSVPINN